MYIVQLITGDKVGVYLNENNSIKTVFIIPKANQDSLEYKIIKIGHDVYVIPADIPQDRFDLELFNVRRLLEWYPNGKFSILIEYIF